MTQEEIFQMFLEDMEQPAIRLAIHRSFRRYADLRDQLIDIYVRKTGIPADEFLTQIALKDAQYLFN